MTQVVVPERPSRVNVPISPKTADALDLMMRRDEVPLAEAVRRLVGYGELLFRTVRLEQGEVLLRHGRDARRVVLLDGHGDSLVQDAAPLLWLRPSQSVVTCAFSRTALEVPGLATVTSIAGCDSFLVADLVADEAAERCRTCRRLAAR